MAVSHDPEPIKILVTNRITWEVTRILQVYRYRWTGTETFHRDGKQQLGMGDCQLRDPQGQTRHMYLVMLGVQSAHERVEAGPCEGIGTPSADDHRRSLSGDAEKETLRTTLSWAIEQITRSRTSYEHVVAQLGLI